MDGSSAARSRPTSVLGWIRTVHDWDWPGADAAYKRAVELEPGNATVIRGAAGLAATLRRFDAAIDLGRRAVELDPLSVPSRLYLGFHALRAGRLDEAEASVRKALELNPTQPSAHLSLGVVYLMRSKPAAALQEMEQEKEAVWRRLGRALAYHALGRRKEADTALAELVEKDKEGFAFQIAEAYAFRGEADEAFAWLERAYDQRDPGLSQIRGDALLKGLEADLRYKAFLKKMRLPL
jgi:tetratricopeptide (TPR) repeat protein